MAIGKKTGGRRKGVPNSERKELYQLMADRYPNYHPVIAMADMANDEENEIDLRFQANKEVAKYVCPQLKAVEISGDASNQITVKIVREQFLYVGVFYYLYKVIIKDYFLPKKHNISKSGIYAIQCIVNHKIYIGSSVSLTHRKSGHFSALKKNKHDNEIIQSDYNLYSDSFIWGIIEVCDKDILMERELYWMRYFDVNNKELGYNKRSNPTSNIGYSMPEKAKKRISNTMKGMKQSDEHRIKQCMARRGRVNTTEQKKHMALSRLKTDKNLLKEVKLFMDENPGKRKLTIDKFKITRKIYEKIRDKNGYYFLWT